MATKRRVALSLSPRQAQLVKEALQAKKVSIALYVKQAGENDSGGVKFAPETLRRTREMAEEHTREDVLSIDGILAALP